MYVLLLLYVVLLLLITGFSLRKQSHEFLYFKKPSTATCGKEQKGINGNIINVDIKYKYILI